MRRPEPNAASSFGIALENYGWNRALAAVLALDSLPAREGEGRDWRCERCGYDHDARMPRFTLERSGVVLAGDPLPVSEMMARGWIATIDPGEPDAVPLILAALQKFFAGEHGLEVVQVKR